MKQRFDLIIFDWDGTLMDSIDWISRCLQNAGADYQCKIPEDQATKDVIGLSASKAIAQLYPEADAQLHIKLVDRYRAHYLSRQLNPDDLFPGVKEMLIKLKADGYQLAVATGKTRAGLQEAMKATQTEDLFCITRCADEAISKPDPKMLHDIIAHTQASKDRCLMVGDSVFDLQMAQNAQIPAVAVTCGAQPAELLQPFKPLLCLQQPTELLNFI
ncbi:MAG: HAD-IIIA family hydrolase [Methylococcales bacterium]|nr:HAD-IIIA family hydrolase [Methylococcales bacterium]